ncbi:MAG: hypothetical protein ACYDGN_03540 [Acidimicrobiales bacterium]
MASDGRWYPPDDHPGLADTPPAIRRHTTLPTGPARPKPADRTLPAPEREPEPDLWRGPVDAQPPDFLPPPGAGKARREHEEFFARRGRPRPSGREHKAPGLPPGSPGGSVLLHLKRLFQKR